MKAQKLALVGVLVALLSVSAFIRIPFPVMPLTVQIFMVIISPMLVGASYSFAAVALYIMLGLLGAPVFSTGGGPAYVLQPSFGFLIGFLLSTIPSGLISKGRTSFGALLLAGAVGLLVIETFGGIGFWFNMNFIQGKEMSLRMAVSLAVAPFILIDFAKVVFAVIIARKLKPAINRGMNL